MAASYGRASRYCPVCQQERPAQEWRRVFRRIRSGDGQGSALVLRHIVCNEIAYFLLE